MANIYKSLDTLYNDAGFSDKYGGSLIVTGVTIIVFFLLISYFNIMINIEPIKKDWVNQRCSPGIMPFAGLINPPPGVSIFQYTNDNFAECTQGILQKITGYFLLPIDMFVKSVHGVFNMLTEALNTIRQMLNLIRVKVGAIAEDLMGKILNIMIPLQKTFLSINDLFGKVQGILAAGIYTALGTYYTMKSAVGAFFQFVVILLVAIAAMVIVSWMIPFTWGIAIALTVTFISIAIPIGMIADALRSAFDLSLPGLPGKPGCFSKNTIINTKNGKLSIKKLTVGTVLDDNSKVTAIMKINAKGHTMYNLHNVIVSGEHIVFHNKEMIAVSKHPNAVEITDFSDAIIYCFSTDNKQIRINDLVFTDWDDLTIDETKELRYTCRNYLSEKYNKSTLFIHKNLESGFYKKTEIQMHDGKKTRICDVKLMDVLKNGEIVIGLVEIDSTDIDNYSYHFKGQPEIIGAPNLQLYNPHLGILYTLDNQIIKNIRKSKKKLYQLITDTGTFQVYDHIFYDYNGALDCFLEKTKQEQLQL